MTPDLDASLLQKLKILQYFAEEQWISFFKFDVKFNNFFTKHDISLITYDFIVNATEQKHWRMNYIVCRAFLYY